MRLLGACGRADLVRALSRGDPQIAESAAELLGFSVQSATAQQTRKQADAASGQTRGEQAEGGSEPAFAPPHPPLDIPFWRVESFAVVAAAETVERPIESAEVEVVWKNRPNDPPRTPLLAPWRELQPRLRCEAAQLQETRTLDVDAVIARQSQGRQIERIPYERRRRWGPRLQIIADRSERLVPYWADQEVVGHALAKLLPAHQIEQAAIWEGLTAPRLLSENALSRDYCLPPPGSLVLVLGDLGCLADGDDDLHQFWVDFGRCVAESGCCPAALLPCLPGRCGKELRAAWRLLPWGRSRGPVVTDPEQRRQRAERLLCLVSPALRIEPGFLRAVRLLLPETEADSGTESDVWQHPALTSTSSAGATIAPDEARRLRAAFSREPKDLQRRVLALLRVWRGPLPQEIWFEEIQCLEPASRRLLPEEFREEDLQLASRFFVQLSQRARGVAAGGVAAGALAWYRRCERRLTDAARSDAAVGPALHRLSWVLHRDEEDYQPGPVFSPVLVPPSRIRRLALVQLGGLLRALDQGGANPPLSAGSPLAAIESGNGLVQIPPVSAQDDFWETGSPPAWADRWGWDEYGAWVEFSVVGRDGQRVAQRLRWIVPGKFLMGSPAGEPGRYDDEGPQHEVTIQEGFWLFDTPCTQALWQAVMGDNPSRFQSPTRPVEQVSWEEVQTFLQRLNAKVPGLNLVLPSEAQWEYACRAGTETALYTGGIEILGRNNAPALDPIAWYGGNSGVEYELNEAVETTSSGWEEMQYPTKRAGTRKVKGKQANPWGLYDMLGNVLEWVEDPWHGNYEGAPAVGGAWVDQRNPLPLGEGRVRESDAGAARVVRGGSWSGYARCCRSAFRFYGRPGRRNGDLGFRCARVQA